VLLLILKSGGLPFVATLSSAFTDLRVNFPSFLGEGLDSPPSY